MGKQLPQQQQQRAAKKAEPRPSGSIPRREEFSTRLSMMVQFPDMQKMTKASQQSRYWKRFPKQSRAIREHVNWRIKRSDEEYEALKECIKKVPASKTTWLGFIHWQDTESRESRRILNRVFTTELVTEDCTNIELYTKVSFLNSRYFIPN